ncbi:hypothetical protein TNCV_3098471 [Trichonephila clavipes]|nr:hypothetical protein TNCV_3098471 [Trichonephila clavipes]
MLDIASIQNKIRGSRQFYVTCHSSTFVVVDSSVPDLHQGGKEGSGSLFASGRCGNGGNYSSRAIAVW